ncbi:MAG: hypothetical protein Q8R76_01105 [Candidatus Omnitrophota bacterium]|nr:hypothetical protein [Candidatus Omnitrophota bacterium]
MLRAPHEKQNLTFPLRSPGPVLLWAVAGLNFLLLVFLLFRYPIEMPWADEWDNMDRIRKVFEGTLSFNDFWAWSSQHRSPFPRLIQTYMARLTHWDLRYEVVLNLSLAGGTFAAFCCALLRAKPCLGSRIVRQLIPVVFLMVYSIGQWKCWIWGEKIVNFICFFTAITGLVFLTAAPFRWRRFGLAAGLGALSNYSFSGGLVYWPVGWILLCLNEFRTPGQKRCALGLWVVAAVLVVTPYMHGFDFYPPYRDPTHILEDPGNFLIFIFVFLGGPVAVVMVPGQFLWPLLTGIVGCALFFAFSFYLLFQTKIPREYYLSFFGIGLFVFANDLLAAVGRGGLGHAWARDGQYITAAYPFWIAVLVFGALVFRSTAVPKLRSLSAVVCVSITVLTLHTSVFSVALLTEAVQSIRGSIQRFADAGDPDALKAIHVKPHLLEEHIKILRDRKLTIFNYKDVPMARRQVAKLES